jgi:predicted ATPase
MEFDRCISQVRQHTHRRLETCGHCARLLQEAAHIYQGDFLTGISLHGCQAFEEWALVWRERLHRQLCEVLSDLSAYHAGHDDLRSALEVTERWAHIDPLSEPAQRRLMRVLALDGQRTQALARFTGFRKLLAGELGVEPARETHQLYERILAEEYAQANIPGMPGKLPVPLTPFIGRGDELAELTAWLRDPHLRLVTLLGPGGSGKTRLALQVAHALRYDFQDGLFLVSLSGLGSSEAFLPALANTLGLVFQSTWGNPFDQLLGFLHNRHMLLILDSFEEAPAANQWITRLLQGIPRLQLLITSRARLNLQAEQVFPLEGLLYPDPADLDTAPHDLQDYSALQLFHSTARQVRPDYTYTPADLRHLVRICQLVGGMPLGLILAAGWLETCSPAEIAAEIERSLDFLASTWNDLPERQRSLRATLDHSYQLLTADERQAFQKLSVFQGTFTRQAAEQVTGVSSLGLRGLVDKSMLQASQGSYRLHDLLRQYAAEKLASDASLECRVRAAHSAWYLERLAEYEMRLKSAQRSATLREIDNEVNDLQSAWKWACTQGDVPLLTRSLEGLCLYYEMRVRFREAEQACQAGLGVLAVNPGQLAERSVLRARLLLWQAHLLTLLGELEAARQLHQQAAELLDRLESQALDVRRARAMYWQAIGDAQAELKTRLECYQRGITLYHALGDAWREAGMLVWAGEFAIRVGDAGLAMQHQQEALRLARQVGEPSTLLHSLRQITFLYFFLNQYETARQFIQETMALVETVEELPLRANTNLHLGVTLAWNGRSPEAIRTLEAVLPQLRSLGYHYGVVYGTFVLGFSYILTGENARGEAILQAGFLEAEQGAFHREAAGMLVALGMAALSQGRLPQAEEYFQDSVQRYRQIQYPGELCMALGGLALVQQAAGKAEAARASLVEALGTTAKIRNIVGTFTGLPAMAYLLARRGHLEPALRVHRIAILQPSQQNSHWYNQVIGNEMTAHWEALPPEHRAEIDASACQHNAFTIIPEVLALLEPS